MHSESFHSFTLKFPKSNPFVHVHEDKRQHSQKGFKQSRRERDPMTGPPRNPFQAFFFKQHFLCQIEQAIVYSFSFIYLLFIYFPSSLALSRRAGQKGQRRALASHWPPPRKRLPRRLRMRRPPSFRTHRTSSCCSRSRIPEDLARTGHPSPPNPPSKRNSTCLSVIDVVKSPSRAFIACSMGPGQNSTD